jgi:endogenous inhibitor of DNA gyrase (YacG/DUF329 family)
MHNCLYCGKTPERKRYLYCSNQCQMDFQYEVFISNWKSGKIKVATRNISSHLRRYLQNKYNNACCLCGWCKVNSVTNKVPLEVNHVDGDSSNNLETNLQLICPNCHSLTANFRNLNRGSGRSWRRIIQAQ